MNDVEFSVGAETKPSLPHECMERVEMEFNSKWLDCGCIMIVFILSYIYSSSKPK